MQISHNKSKGILKLYRDEGITIKEKKLTLKIFQSYNDTVTTFDVYSINLFGNFEHRRGDHADEVQTII